MINKKSGPEWASKKRGLLNLYPVKNYLKVGHSGPAAKWPTIKELSCCITKSYRILKKWASDSQGGRGPILRKLYFKGVFMADKIDLIDIADVINEEIKKITAIIDIVEVSQIEFLSETTIPGLCHIMRYSMKRIMEETGKLRGNV